MLALDHVIYVVRDLDVAARRIRFELGLDSYPGGEHAGMGTHNRVVPVGGNQYVELMATKDAEAAATHPFAALIDGWAAQGERLRTWCLATDDIDAVGRRLGLEAAAWSRERPDGVQLRWRLCGVEQSNADPSLPFFIQWDVPTEQHPSGGAVSHTVEPQGFAWLEVGGDAGRIATWTDGADLPIRVVDADEGPRAVGIQTPDGEVVLR